MPAFIDNIPLADVDERRGQGDRTNLKGVVPVHEHEIPAMLTAGGCHRYTSSIGGVGAAPGSALHASSTGVVESSRRCIGLILQGNPDQLRASRSDGYAMLQTGWRSGFAERIQAADPIGRFAQADEIRAPCCPGVDDASFTVGHPCWWMAASRD